MAITRDDVEHPTSFDKGYEDGFENRDNSEGKNWCSVCYAIGHYRGCDDREEVQGAGSSNS